MTTIALEEIQQILGRLSDAADERRIVQLAKRIVDGAMLFKASARNERRATGNDEAADQLRAAERRARLLKDAIEAFGFEAEWMFKKSLRHDGHIEFDAVFAAIEKSASAARTAAKFIESQPPTQRGAPRSVVDADAVARHCADAFEELTGRRATVSTNNVNNRPSGGFYELVRDVFDVTGIGSSAERAARAVAKERRAQKVAETPFDQGSGKKQDRPS